MAEADIPGYAELMGDSSQPDERAPTPPPPDYPPGGLSPRGRKRLSAAVASMSAGALTYPLETGSEESRMHDWVCLRSRMDALKAGDLVAPEVYAAASAPLRALIRKDASGRYWFAPRAEAMEGYYVRQVLGRK